MAWSRLIIRRGLDLSLDGTRGRGSHWALTIFRVMVVHSGSLHTNPVYFVLQPFQEATCETSYSTVSSFMAKEMKVKKMLL